MDTLREKHEFTRARKAQPQSWYSFSSGTSWFTYGASFTANGRARVELYIDSTDRERNKLAFDKLEQQKTVLESKLKPLEWERFGAPQGEPYSNCLQLAGFGPSVNFLTCTTFRIVA